MANNLNSQSPHSKVLPNLLRLIHPFTIERHWEQVARVKFGKPIKVFNDKVGKKDAALIRNLYESLHNLKPELLDFYHNLKVQSQTQLVNILEECRADIEQNFSLKNITQLVELLNKQKRKIDFILDEVIIEKANDPDIGWMNIHSKSRKIPLYFTNRYSKDIATYKDLFTDACDTIINLYEKSPTTLWEIWIDRNNIKHYNQVIDFLYKTPQKDYIDIDEPFLEKVKVGNEEINVWLEGFTGRQYLAAFTSVCQENKYIRKESAETMYRIYKNEFHIEFKNYKIFTKDQLKSALTKRKGKYAKYFLEELPKPQLSPAVIIK